MVVLGGCFSTYSDTLGMTNKDAIGLNYSVKILYGIGFTARLSGGEIDHIKPSYRAY